MSGFFFFVSTAAFFCNGGDDSAQAAHSHPTQLRNKAHHTQLINMPYILSPSSFWGFRRIEEHKQQQYEAWTPSGLDTRRH